jgi:hypothetical protein
MAQATVNGQARPEPSLNGSNTNGGPDTSEYIPGAMTQNEW